MTPAKHFRSYFTRRISFAVLLLGCLSHAQLLHSAPTLTDSDLQAKIDSLKLDEQKNDINADDYIGFKVPNVQLLLLDPALSGISIQEIFSDELNGRLQFEIELTTDAFSDQTVKIRPTWYDAEGNKVESSTQWEKITIIPKSLKIIDVVAPNSKAKELILHIKR